MGDCRVWVWVRAELDPEEDALGDEANINELNILKVVVLWVGLGVRLVGAASASVVNVGGAVVWLCLLCCTVK
ncbi:hypothetical protein BDV98DRAFT_568342 [Pterulicium gracile]|uniref:Uncharacterized protein n=1 Tax=Pterulicium gracile TaxID=1884261 RepID=A0A5C3QG18_9AGAR|nr:hypothetical protein BDV98DRAFT_568342 [Pterula gracilis]